MQKKIFFPLVIFFALFQGRGCSQTINLSDSLRHVLSHKPVFTAKLDTRNSFITGQNAKVQGIKIGFAFRKSLTIGLGYNWMGTPLDETIFINDAAIITRIKLRYIAPFLEYSFYRKGPWEATVPVQLGFGKSFLQYDMRGSTIRSHEGNVVLYEPGMNIEYKILKLIGVGAGVGYRIMLKNNHEINQRFTSPVYVLRFRIIFEEVYKKVKDMKEK